MMNPRRRMGLMPACALAVLSACSSTGHTPVSDYPLMPATDVVAEPEHPEASWGLDAPPEGQSIATWTAAWIDGPASAFATEEEVANYRQLGGAAQREEFIRLFWERRTSPPGGAALPPVDTARRRTQLAEELFGAEGTPGWRTPFIAPHFVEFTYGANDWSLRCGKEWVADGQSAKPDPADDVVESPVSPNTSDRALGSAFTSVSGYKASSDYDPGPPRHTDRFGPGCLDLFEHARASWITSPIETATLGRNSD